MRVQFNRPYVGGKEIASIAQAIENAHLSGDGPFAHSCQKWLEDRLSCCRAILTNSATAALEMAAILLELGADDEVVMPSFTFPSTANAFVLRGARPVFVDIRPDTLNIDERLIESAITERTKAIAVVHYAGVGCEMAEIMAIAGRHNLPVVEDAAHGLLATYRDKPLGTFGRLSALSFHETKNLISGEGGALIINDPSLTERAEIIAQKGTDRSRYFRGQVDKYTWVDLGSSHLPSELQAAFLWSQMTQSSEIQKLRLEVWNSYHQLLEPLEKQGVLRRPLIPEHSCHNAHLYYILVEDLQTRGQLLEFLNAREVRAMFHYAPLHSSAAGRRFGRYHGIMRNTEEASDRLIRLPFWVGLTPEAIDYVVATIRQFFQGRPAVRSGVNEEKLSR